MKITNNGIIMQPLGDKDVFASMNRGAKLLNDVKYWFSAGTVLGLVREKGWIKHDTDIDAEVAVENEDDIQHIVYRFITNGYKLIRVMMHEDKPMQIAFLHDDMIIFDIYFYYRAEDGWYNYNEGGTLKMPNKFIDETEKVLGFTCPSPVEEYLEARYGDWKTPRTEKQDWRIDAKKGGLLI